jgi:hypothetical protein
MAQFQFNANDAPAPQQRSFGPLPSGDYPVVITRSDVKPTKAGTGHYIELEIQVTDGEHSGRRLWERLNVDNPNKTAEDIAKAALGQLCEAVDVLDMEDTEQLHDIPFVISVEIDRKEPDRNRIVAYSKVISAPARPAPAPKPAAAGARPWQK